VRLEGKWAHDLFQTIEIVKGRLSSTCRYPSPHRGKVDKKVSYHGVGYVLDDRGDRHRIRKEQIDMAGRRCFPRLPLIGVKRFSQMRQATSTH